MKSPRIAGIDLIYVLLLPAMLVAFGIIETAERSKDILHNEFHLIFDLGMALFLFMNGLTTAFAADSGMNVANLQKYLLKKGLILLAIAAPLSFVSQSNPFLLLAILSILSSGVIMFTSSILIFLLSIIGMYSAYYFMFTDVRIDLLIQANGYDLNQIWNYPLRGSYYSLIPWAGFYVTGLVVSRLEFIRKASSLVHVIVGIFILTAGLAVAVFTESNQLSAFNKSIMPQGLTLLMLNFPGFFLAMLGLSIILTDFNNWATARFSALAGKTWVRTMSKSKYTIILVFIAVCMVMKLIIGVPSTSFMRLIWSISATTITLSIMFLIARQKRLSFAPVEKVIKYFSGM
jgi:hypothetical protein